MDVQKLLNLNVDRGPPVKYLEAKKPSLTEFVCSQFEQAIDYLDEKTFCQEVELLKQFYAKYRNAQRHFIHFKTFSMLRRKSRHLNFSQPSQILRCAVRQWKLKPDEGHLSPTRQMFDFALVAWMQLAFDVYVSHRIGERCFVRCRKQTNLGHFSKLNFVFMSMVARISLHLENFLQFLTSTFKSLLHARKFLPAAKVEWLPESLKFPRNLKFDELALKCATVSMRPEEPSDPNVASEKEEGPAREQRPTDFASLLWANTEFVTSQTTTKKKKLKKKKKKNVEQSINT